MLKKVFIFIFIFFSFLVTSGQENFLIKDKNNSSFFSSNRFGLGLNATSLYYPFVSLGLKFSLAESEKNSTYFSYDFFNASSFPGEEQLIMGYLDWMTGGALDVESEHEIDIQYNRYAIGRQHLQGMGDVKDLNVIVKLLTSSWIDLIFNNNRQYEEYFFYELGYSNFERENNDVLIFSGEEDQSFISAALGLRLVYRLDNKPVGFKSLSLEYSAIKSSDILNQFSFKYGFWWYF